MAKGLQIQFPSEKVALVRISGDRRRPEPETVRIAFPGGSVDVVRARDGEDADYWVHLLVNRKESQHLIDGEDQLARVVDARVDVHGGENKAVEFKDSATYHIAIRVCTDGVFSLREHLGKDPSGRGTPSQEDEIELDF